MKPCLTITCVIAFSQACYAQSKPVDEEVALLSVTLEANQFLNEQDKPLGVDKAKDGALTLALYPNAAIPKPIWTVTHDQFSFGPKGRVGMLIGQLSPLVDKNGKPISFKPPRGGTPPWLLLSYKVGNETYRTRRLPIASTGYAKESGIAYGSDGRLERRIRELEARLNQKDKDVLKAIQTLNLLHKEVNGIQPLADLEEELKPKD